MKNDQLDFVLEDFTRVQWAPEASEWKLRIARVSSSYQAMEIKLVALGFKPSALLVVSPDVMPHIVRLACEADLNTVILGRQ